MKTITLRIDKELHTRMSNFDLTIQESAIRILKWIKKGRITPNPCECGVLTEYIKIDVPDDLSNIELTDLRNGLIEVFRTLRPVPPIHIPPEDLRAMKRLKMPIPQYVE